VEEKAAHIVNQLDAEDLLRHCPPLADLRKQRLGPIVDAEGQLTPYTAGRGYFVERQQETALMWLPGPDGVLTTRPVHLWIVLSGIQADAPQRQLLHKNLKCAANRGCDWCTLLGQKGDYNCTKYLGYSEPCDAEVLHPADGRPWGKCRAWASGAVVPNSHCSVERHLPAVDGVCHEVPPAGAKRRRDWGEYTAPSAVRLTAVQMRGRDEHAEKIRDQMAQQDWRDPKARDKKIDDTMKLVGSRGSIEFVHARLPYWVSKLMSPFAVYHVLYLGIGKDFLHWLNKRLKAATEPHVMMLQKWEDIKLVLTSLCQRIVLRDKPDCILVDFTKHLGLMSMSEMQLFYEVAVPYLVHDLPAFGVPRELCVMWLMLRHGMMLFTRMHEEFPSKDLYRAKLREGRAALAAYAAIAQGLHGAKKWGVKGINDFSFTWKLHVAVGHLSEQLEKCGHTHQGNDMWVERMIRQDATMLVRCGRLVCCSRATGHSCASGTCGAGIGRGAPRRAPSRAPMKITSVARHWTSYFSRPGLDKIPPTLMYRVTSRCRTGGTG